MDWLTKGEPEFYLRQTGSDPYAIWITQLNGLTIKRVAARLLAYADAEKATADVIYLDGKRDVVNAHQMTSRHFLEQA